MSRDPLDRLRDADPLRGTTLPDAADPDAAALRDRVMAHRVTSSGRAGRRRRWMAGVAAVAAAGAAAAAVTVATSRVTDPTSVGCYTGPSTRADTTVLASTGASPVAQCRDLWLDGEMHPGVTSRAHLPPLVACVLDTHDLVGVFPTTSCELVDTSGTGDVDLLVPSTPVEAPSHDGTTPADDEATGLSMPDYGTDDDTVRQALEEIRLALLDRCLTLEAAVDLADRALARRGLEGWTIGPIMEDHADDACAGFFPDAAEQAVWFTPEQPRPGQTPEPR